MTTLPLSEVKARLSEIADEVARTHDRVQVTRNGRPHVVLLAAEDLASLQATLEVLADPNLVARLAVADDEIAAGRYTSEAEMAELMVQRRRREATSPSAVDVAMRGDVEDAHDAGNVIDAVNDPVSPPAS